MPRRLAVVDHVGMHRVPATLVFADLTGYTRLSERLLARGRAGTELLLETIDAMFTSLIEAAHGAGGEVLRFGGDALFLAFTGDDRSDRIDRALRAALAMQAALTRRATVDVPGGRARLRQSIAVHDGDLMVHRWHGPWTEELVFGPVVTTLLELEQRARPGHVVVSPEVAAATRLATVAGPDGTRTLFRAPRAPVDHAIRHGDPLADPASWLPPPVVAALRDGFDAQHRAVAVAFVGVGGLDRACVAGSEAAVADALDEVMDAIGEATVRLGVAPLCTDIAPDGVSVLLTAGALPSHGDDVERLFGLARRLVALDLGERFTVRAGMNTGLAFTAAIGHPARRTIAALGDTTNAAARLEAVADAGELLVTEAVVDQLPARIRLVPRGPVHVVGRRRPLHVAAAADADSESSPTPPDLPLLGRDAEVRRLEAALARPGTSVVEVVGPLGIGKSRVALEVIGRVQRPVVQLHCTVDDVDVPFGAARRLLGLLGAPASDLDDVLLQLSADLDRPPELVRELAVVRVAGAVTAHLRGEPVLVIDLADHLDHSTRRVLERIAAPGQERTMSIVVVHRGGGSLAVAAEVLADVVDLGPLADATIRELLLLAAPHALAEARLRRLVERAVGNPGFALRLATGSPDAELSSDLAALLAAEIDLIPAHARVVARAAALLADRFSAAQVAEVVGLAEPRVVRVLEELHGVVLPSPDGDWRFRNEIVREALVASMPVRTRRDLARRVAPLWERGLRPTGGGDLAGGGFDLADVVRVARAWARAEDDTEMLTWCGRAGREAAAAGATEEAAELLGLAWGAGRRLRSSATVDLAEEWADAASACGRAADAATALATASREAPSAERRASLLVRRVREAARAGRFRSAAVLLAHAASLASSLPTASERDRATLLVSLERVRVSVDRGQFAVAGQDIDRVITLARRVGAGRDLAVALALAGDIDAATGTTESTRAQRAYALALALDDSLLCGAIACNLGVVEDNIGEWPAAIGHYQAAEEHFQRAGSLWSVALARLNRSSILVELGAVDEAFAAVSDAYRELAAAGLAPLAIAAASQLARVAARRGSPIDAELARLELAVAQLHELGETEVALFRELAVVELLLMAGRPVDARTVLERSRVPRAGYGAAHLLPMTGARLDGLTHLLAGDLTLAFATIEQALAVARDHGARGEVCLCLHAAQLVERESGVVPSAERRAELALLEHELGVVSYPILRG